MRIGILVRWVNPVIAQMAKQLESRGVTVDFIFSEALDTPINEFRIEHDLYLIKSGTATTMSLAGMLHAMGAPMLSPFPIVTLLRDKLIVNRLLHEAGIPIPETYIVPTPDALVPHLETGPLIVKPYSGTRGIGVELVNHPDELKNIPETQPIMAQRYHEPDDLDRCDHKVFRIGEQVFGVRRSWPIKTYSDKLGEPFDVPEELRDITMRCGDVFGGIELYGLDIVISKGQPYVVDFNKFGSYMGVPNAPELLASFIYEKGQRALKGQDIYEG